MDYLKVSESLEEIEQTLSFKYKDSYTNLQKYSSFPLLPAHKLNSTLNTQIYANQSKLKFIEKLKNEIENLKKSSNLDNRFENLQSQLEKIEVKSKSVKKSNKEYEFIKKRVTQEKTELKKKLQIIQTSYDKVLAAYPKVLGFKDHAFTNLNLIKQNFDEYEKDRKLINLKQEKEFKEKQRLKDIYSEKSKELIHKIGSIVYLEKVNQAKLIDTFEERQKYLSEIEEINNKNKEIRKMQENTSNSLSTLNEIFIQRNIPLLNSPSESILSILKLYKDEEYRSISLSLKFNDLSSTILSKKRICQELKAELDSFSSRSTLKNDDIELLESFKVHKDFQAESQLCKIYAQIFSYASNIFGKLKIIEENSPDHLKKNLPGMEFSNNSNNSHSSSRIHKKRSMNFIKKTKTITKSKTIRDVQTKVTFTDKNMQFSQNFHLSDAFYHYKLISREDLQYFLTNPIVLLCLKPGDALGVIKNPSGKSDLVKLYQLSHSNMKYFIQSIMDKLTDALINARETVPDSFHFTQQNEYSISSDLNLPKSRPRIKFSVESSKGFEGKSTDQIIRNEQNRLKFYSESNTPISATTNITDAIKEMWSVSKRLRIIESSEKKASVSNKIIRKEMSKFKSTLPSFN